MASIKPKGLGRGLEVLLGPKLDADPSSTTAQADFPNILLLDDLVPGVYQPRTRMDEGALYELAESIRAQGIMQPILVRLLAEPQGQTRLAQWQTQQGLAVSERGARPVYEIIAGERRFRAARLAGLDRVPVLVRDVPDEAAAAMALIENIQREGLNPLEEAQGLQRLVQEFGLTHEQAAQAVGRSRSASTNLLRLLQLASPVQTLLMAGDIDMGHARALLSLDKATQTIVGHQIASQQLSVREAEALVKKRLAPADATPHKKAAAKQPSADVRRLEEELADVLGATVEVRVKKRVRRNGRLEDVGELAIGFSSLDELQGVIERLRALNP
ncbi:MAG: putative transcriptional regulator [Pseudomonadota bacterium]|jgi:ParB family chromosome partitioning protein